MGLSLARIVRVPLLRNPGNPHMLGSSEFNEYLEPPVFYNRHSEAVVNALGRSMNKGVSLFLNPSQVGAYVGISQRHEVRVICRVECDSVEPIQSCTNRGISIERIFQERRGNMSKAIAKEVLEPSFKVCPKQQHQRSACRDLLRVRQSVLWHRVAFHAFPLTLHQLQINIVLKS